MSRLDQLISQYCLAGVPMVRLGEVCKAEKAKNKGQIIKDAYSITQSGLVRTSSFFKEKTHVTSENTSGYYIVRKGWFVYSPSRIDVGSINFLKDDGPVIVSPIDVVFSIDESKLLQTYLLSYLLMPDGMNQILSYREGVEGTGRRSLPFKEFSKISIPLPPLPVQEEIVRILDAMSDLVTNLDAEISARQKQYEHAREKLLTFGEEVERKTLGEVGTIIRGNGLQKSDFREYGVGCIHYGQIYTYFGIFTDKTISFVEPELAEKLTQVNTGDIIIATTSENIEDVCKSVCWLGQETIVSGAHAVVYKHSQNPKYIAYCLRTWDFFAQKKKYAYGAKVIDIKTSDLANISIPLPPLSVQQSIVEQLDKMESLIQNLQAERALRQKQYEYYREKLLLFAK